jgi:hypothetical protein
MAAKKTETKDEPSTFPGIIPDHGNKALIGSMMQEVKAIRDSGRGVKQKGGKVYTMVQDRVETIRRLAGDSYRITTDIIQWSSEPGGLIVVRATVTNEVGDVVATGHAEEVRGSNYINETSALENCETSAVGRALAVFGIHGGEFASADEISIAHDKRDKIATLKTVPANTTANLAVKEKPAPAQEAPVPQQTVQLDLEDSIVASGGPKRSSVADAKVLQGLKPEVVEGVERIDGNTPVVRANPDHDMLEEVFATLIPLCPTVDESYAFWHKNEHLIKQLKTEAPEHYARVLAYFTTHKATLIAKGKK